MPATARKRILEGVVALGILGGLFAFLYPAIQAVRDQPSSFSPGPDGEIIPKNAPLEANRITHESGLSIIAPENWEQIRDFGPDVPWLFIAARVQGARRLTASILIQNQETVPRTFLADSEKIVYHGHTAHEMMVVEREYSFDDPASSRYTLYVDVAGQWWSVEYGVAKEMRRLPYEVRRFIDTITFPHDASEQTDEREPE